MEQPDHAPLKLPTTLVCRVNELDKPVVAALMQSTGITDTSQLVRYCMRAALRELGANGAAVGTATRTHRSADSKG